MGFRELLVARYIRVRGAEMGESSGARRGGTGGRVLSRSLALVCLGLVGLGVMAASTSGRADGLGLRGRAEQALATCSYTPLSLSLTGTGNVEDMRPFNAAVGDSYFQFAPAEPITVTGLSDGQALINQNLAGSVSGGMSGSFVMSSLNGGVINTISTSSE